MEVRDVGLRNWGLHLYFGVNPANTDVIKGLLILEQLDFLLFKAFS